MSQGNLLVELVNLWGEYEKLVPEPTVYDFCLWYFKREATDLPKKVDDIDAEIRESEIVDLLHRLNKFYEFYAKKALENGGLSNVEDMVFLNSMEQLRDFRKGLIVEANVMEMPSGIDVIERLEKSKLIDAIPDLSDRRAKLVRLTQRGRQVLQRNKANIQKAAELTVQPLNQKEKELFRDMLQLLDGFHSKTYTNKTRLEDFDSIQERLKNQ